jgi:xanthine dehydrogenase accessory factor
MEIYEELLRLKKEGRPSALATIVQCRGSSPQKEGAKMLIREDGSTLGTLGGGCLEFDVIQAALMTIQDGKPVTLPFDLTEKHGGLICGGKVLVYIEPNHPEPHLVILGAGHVGKAVSKVARFSGFRVTVADNREEYANVEHIPTANEVVVHDFVTIFSRVAVDENTYILIATRGHNHDLAALQSALRTQAQYIGLLGSRRKKTVLFKTLEDQGFLKEEIARVIIPVGLPIGSVTPEEIAVSIMAQIIQQRRANAPSSHHPTSCSRVLEKNG